jgi:hypothetical protein
LIKNIPIVERFRAQLRGEVFNVLNRTQFNGPDTNPTSGNFGRITSAANLPRAVQLHCGCSGNICGYVVFLRAGGSSTGPFCRYSRDSSETGLC